MHTMRVNWKKSQPVRNTYNDLVLSSTRRDDLLLDETTLNRMWIIRKFIAEMTPVEAMNTIRDRLVSTRSNEEFLMSMNG